MPRPFAPALLLPLLLTPLAPRTPAAGAVPRMRAAAVAAQAPDDATAFEQSGADVIALLNRQAADWNRGDLDAFASGYKNAPDILFMGSHIEHGYDNMLRRYKANYPTHESMGTLSFTQLAVQLLDARFVTATGRFHLERTAAGGGNADGYFLLVVERTAGGWKIVRDATTALPAR